MKGDFSQFVLGADGYSRVLMQQGRVVIDTDWNTLVAQLVGGQRAQMQDLIGPHAGPAPKPGFAIASTTTSGKADLTIGQGIYYVDGIRVANTGPPGGEPDDTFLYSNQPYRFFDGPPDLAAAPFLAYLDVWERHVTALEDGDLREVALGGPDTTTRTEVVWQVRAQPLTGDDWQPFAGLTCKNFDADRLGTFRRLLTGNPPLLKAKAREAVDTADDPCLSPHDARYRGPENQLYRVEIHAVDDGDVTFVWSRENGSVVAAWLETHDDDLIVTGVRDKVRGFQAGDWVELSHDDLEVRAEAGVLVRLARVDGDVLTVDRNTATGTIDSAPAGLRNAKVRRWDQKERAEAPLAGGAVKVETGTGDGGWTELEDGIEVQFQPPPGKNGSDDYRVGDHWVFPARVATGDIIWPRDHGDPIAIPPHGVKHHYAPLAIVIAPAGAAPKAVDLRRRFVPLTQCVAP